MFNTIWWKNGNPSNILQIKMGSPVKEKGVEIWNLKWRWRSLKLLVVESVWSKWKLWFQDQLRGFARKVAGSPFSLLLLCPVWIFEFECFSLFFFLFLFFLFVFTSNSEEYDCTRSSVQRTNGLVPFASRGPRAGL